MTVERKKISAIPEIGAINGDENLLLGVTGGNKRISTKRFKEEYIGESVTQIFAEKISGIVSVMDGIATPEEGATIDIVFLTDMNRFASRKTIDGTSSYLDQWNGRDNYQTEDNKIRTDRVFFCTSDKGQYGWDGEDLSPIVPFFKESTEEEIEEMIANNTWEKGFIYYTVED